MNKKDGVKLPQFSITAPGLLEALIFQCFRFAEWRKDVSSDIQFRILCGSIAIAFTFLFYYITLFVWVLKSGDKNGKIKELLYISLFAILGFASFLIHYIIA